MSHVEFLGPPGSGKTTIYTRLSGVDLLYRPFVDSDGGDFRSGEDVRVHDKVRNALRFLRRRPAYARLLIRTARNAAHESVHLVDMLLGTAAEYEYAARSRPPEKTIVLDEGFLQRAFSIRFRTDPGAFDLPTYLDVVPLPSVLVHVDAPADVCDSRQRNRDKDVLSKPWLGDDDTVSVLDDLRANCAWIADRVEDRGVTVIRIENTGSVDDVVDRTQRELRTLFDTT